MTSATDSDETWLPEWSGNMMLRTRRLRGLSYGDKASHLRPVSIAGLVPAKRGLSSYVRSEV